ncbi:DUF4468 domain-containing protein [Leptobacterium sp. I13]|uniref:DUF4468 domain-containing protein n=1 Tax=Leptobacterium meishanense TaxID=3128904 RepID=UPI0030EB5568
MHKLFGFAFLLISSFSFAQFKIDSLNGNVKFIKVYTVADTSKKAIYQKCKEWVAINFKDSNSVIKLDTKDKILVKGLFDINYISNGYPITSNVDFVMSVSFKDGRYKLQMDNFIIVNNVNGQIVKTPINNYNPSMSYEEYKERLLKQAEEQTDEFIKKATYKILQNEKQLRKSYDETVEVSKNILGEVKTEIENTFVSLNNYVNKNSDDEDW